MMFENHPQCLNIVFQFLQKAGLAFEISKCQFGKQATQYLVFQLTSDRLRVDNSKTIAIQVLPH